MDSYYYWNNNTLILKIYLQTGAKQNEVIGAYGDHLKIKVKSRSIEGKANECLIKFLAQSFDVSLSCVTLIKGHQSRKKQVAIENPKVLIMGIKK